MDKTTFFIVLLLFFCPAYDLSIQVDYASMCPLFQVMDTLTQDQEPAAKQWQALFRTPAYQSLARTLPPYTSSFFKKHFRMAWKPSLEKSGFNTTDQQDSQPGEIHSQAALLRHYRRAKTQRKPLESFVKAFDIHTMKGPIEALLNPYLPKGFRQVPVTISFALFSEDAQEGTPIVLDPLFFLSMEAQDRAPMLAHEIHHVQRMAWEKRCLGPKESALRQDLQVLKYIMHEGIADRINVAMRLNTPAETRRFREDPCAQGKDYLCQLQKSPAFIRAMDGILAELSRHPHQSKKAVRALYQAAARSGHLPGFYMATVIEEALGRDRLIANQINPAHFFLLYDKAASISQKGSPFSPPTKRFLKQLARQWTQ